VLAAPLLLVQAGPDAAASVGTPHATAAPVRPPTVRTVAVTRSHRRVHHTPTTAPTPVVIAAAPVRQVVPATTTTSTVPPTTTTTSTVPPTTTTTLAPRSAGSDVRTTGIVTYYAHPAGYCASPWLPFGTVVEVTNPANGASVSCVVNDREADTARSIDLATDTFAEIAPLSQGVVDAVLTW
jgi:hypothetical protein